MRTKVLFIVMCFAAMAVALEPSQPWSVNADSVYVSSATTRVGIGTASPQEALHVEGYVYGSGGHGSLRIKTDCGVTAIGCDSWAYSHFDTNLPRFYFYKPVMIGNGELSSGKDNNMTFKTFNGSSYTTRMLIKYSNGYVGIGTTTPAYKLDVNGDLRASKIYTTEVKVSVPAGADYVFAPDYQLPSLDAVKTFIQENQHLPEIQSEQDMQENGVNLNEFQIQLLKKIEQLTLYIIQQDERIKELEAKQ